MEHRFDKIEEKLDNIKAEIHELNLLSTTRLTKLETTQKGFIGIVSMIMTACIAFVASMIKSKF